MASKSTLRLPSIDFSGLDLQEPGTAEWAAVRRDVMLALEQYGSFDAIYKKVSPDLREALFGSAVKELFSLPVETKKRNISNLPNHGYLGEIPGLAFESITVDDATRLESVQRFACLMWPNEGPPTFCQTVWMFAKQVAELEHIIWRMILESFGIEKYYESRAGSTSHGLRLSEYGPPGSHEARSILESHQDPNFMSVLCQHKVEGLEIMSREGDWIHVTYTPYSLTVLLGDATEAWFNGRLRAVHHRVAMSGSETRYCAIFGSQPKDGYTVQAPQELVDEEHPLVYKPYQYLDCLRFRFSEEGRKAKHVLRAFCGVEGVQEAAEPEA